MSTPYIGEISLVAFNFPPQGWATCDGQLLSISQNTALFSLLGTTYGGDGINTFALPDLRGRAMVHSGGGYPMGFQAGVENVTLNAGEMPPHSHAPACSTGTGTTAVPTGQVWAGSSSNEMLYQGGASAGGTMASGLITSTGGSQPHPNLQPFLVLNFIIALQGVFPSRS